MEKSEQIKLEDELYCLRYELNALSDCLLRNENERWVPQFIHNITEEEHIERYKFVLDKIEGKSVLDMACGSGYGTYLLGTNGKAKSVVGVDINSDSIKYGNIKYPGTNIIRVVDDATKFTSDFLFDVIVSFETIEHIENYQMFLDNLTKNLAPNGLLFISSPITQVTTSKNLKNPFHVIEWSFSDFQNLFSKDYNIREIYLQSVRIKMKEWKRPNLLKKIKNRIIPDNDIYFINGEIFEKYTGQYDMSKCGYGYQILVLEKKEI